MNCPKCGKEMIYGKIGISAGSKGFPASMFWAPDEVFNKPASQFMTLKKVLAGGGMQIKIGNGLTSNRTVGYACKDCNCVLFDFMQIGVQMDAEMTIAFGIVTVVALIMIAITIYGAQTSLFSKEI